MALEQSKMKKEVEKETFVFKQIRSKVKVENKIEKREYDMIIRRDVDSSYEPEETGDIKGYTFTVKRKEEVDVVPRILSLEKEWMIKIERNGTETSHFVGDEIVEKHTYRVENIDRNLNNQDVIAAIEALKIKRAEGEQLYEEIEEYPSDQDSEALEAQVTGQRLITPNESFSVKKIISATPIKKVLSVFKRKSKKESELEEIEEKREDQTLNTSQEEIQVTTEKIVTPNESFNVSEIIAQDQVFVTVEKESSSRNSRKSSGYHSRESDDLRKDANGIAMQDLSKEGSRSSTEIQKLVEEQIEYEQEFENTTGMGTDLQSDIHDDTLDTTRISSKNPSKKSSDKSSGFYEKSSNASSKTDSKSSNTGSDIYKNAESGKSSSKTSRKYVGPDAYLEMKSDQERIASPDYSGDEEFSKRTSKVKFESEKKSRTSGSVTPYKRSVSAPSSRSIKNKARASFWDKRHDLSTDSESDSAITNMASGKTTKVELNDTSEMEVTISSKSSKNKPESYDTESLVVNDTQENSIVEQNMASKVGQKLRDFTFGGLKQSDENLKEVLVHETKAKGKVEHKTYKKIGQVGENLQMIADPRLKEVFHIDLTELVVEHPSRNKKNSK